MSSAENTNSRNEISAAELQILRLKSSLWDLTNALAQKDQMLNAASEKIIELQREIERLSSKGQPEGNSANDYM